VAVAGDLDLASYLASSLATAPDLGDEANIRQLRARAEELTRSAADRFYRSKQYQGRRSGDARASLIVGGVNPGVHKRIKKERVPEVIEVASTRYLLALNQMQAQIERASDMSTAITMMRALIDRKNRGLPLPPALIAAMSRPPDDDGLIPLDSVDTHLFSVTVTPHNFALEDAEWGFGLVGGANAAVRKDVAPNELMAVAEAALEGEAQIHLVTEILETAKQHGNNTVGGGVVTIRINESGLAFGTSRVLRPNSTSDAFETVSETSFDGTHLFVRDGSELVRLVPFIAWGSEGGAVHAATAPS
jgi:hypothetical protein